MFMKKRHISGLLLAAFSSLSILAGNLPVRAGDMETLKLDLPKPQFQGTPIPVKLPHLEKREPNAKRPDFLVPKGTVLLSRGKPVSASDEFPLIGDPALVCDGNKEAVDGSFLELGPGRQWVQIDLGVPARIHAVILWLYHAEPRVSHDVIVQISDTRISPGRSLLYSTTTTTIPRASTSERISLISKLTKES